MTGANRNPGKPWTRKKALILAIACLAVGIAGGWLIRGLQSRAATGSARAAVVPAPAERETSTASQMPDPARLKEMADAQAAPLLAKLKANPNNPDLLTSAGNVYYDARQYPAAVDFYARALKARPSDAAVRTDMATAYWFMGNAHAAIAEFNKALAYAPNNPNTLFNLGLVKWQGKKDAAGALADWEKLLAANPKYEGKDQVEEMMAEVKKQAAVQPGMKAK